MLIIFDLDGTLIDSSTDLAISTNATRAEFGMEPLDPSLISSYVGNGAEMLVRRAMGPETPETRVQEAHAFFLKYYRAHALENTKPYPGICELIEQVADRGYTQAILTNKPERISFDIIGALQLQKYFFRVYGGNSLPAKKPDPIGISTLMKDAGTSLADTVMVGDSAVDVQTARNAGVRSCGVLWGFQPEGFSTDPPDYLIQRPAEILDLLPPV